MKNEKSSKSSNICKRVYLQFQRLSNSIDFADSLWFLDRFMMVLIALSSFFSLKKVLISEKIFVLSGLGIGISICRLATSNILNFRYI